MSSRNLVIGLVIALYVGFGVYRHISITPEEQAEMDQRAARSQETFEIERSRKRAQSEAEENRRLESEAEARRFEHATPAQREAMVHEANVKRRDRAHRRAAGLEQMDPKLAAEVLEEQRKRLEGRR